MHLHRKESFVATGKDFQISFDGTLKSATDGSRVQMVDNLSKTGNVREHKEIPPQE